MSKRTIIALALMASLTACNRAGYIEEDSDPDASAGHYRAPGAESSPTQSAVVEWTPAPGQFINEPEFANAAEATAWAADQLRQQRAVSLGAWGGYIVVTFDHSILNSGGEYDFAVLGNAFGTNGGAGCSNEPGTVWVMQDTNGNGMPDDTWHELRGSEANSPATIHHYHITYFRPAEPDSPTHWRDNQGNSGTVDHVKAFHSQPFYYPLWIAGDSISFSGTRLAANNREEADGNWLNAPLPWGYADNMGSDSEKNPQRNRFRISDAENAPAYIDFIKVQTAVNATSGHLGEISTEVCGFIDLNL